MRHPHSRDFADSGIAFGNKHFAVDFRGVILRTSNIYIVAAVIALDQNIDFLADPQPVALARDFSLQLHQLADAVLFYIIRNLVGQAGSRRILFFGIGKHAQTVKLDIFNELFQISKILLGFPGESYDKGSSERNARYSCANFLYERANLFVCRVFSSA